MNLLRSILFIFILSIGISQEFINDYEWRLFQQRNTHLNKRAVLKSSSDRVTSNDSKLIGLRFNGKVCWLRRVLPNDDQLPDQVRFNVGRFIYALESGEQNFVDVVIEKQGIRFADLAYKTKIESLLKKQQAINVRTVNVVADNDERKVSLRIGEIDIDLYFKLSNAPSGDRFYQPYEDAKIKRLIDSNNGSYQAINNFDQLDSFSEFFGYPLVTKDRNEISNIFYKKKGRFDLTKLDISILNLWRQKNQKISNLLQGVETAYIQINTSKKLTRKVTDRKKIIGFLSSLLAEKKVYSYLMKDEKLLAVIAKHPNYLFYHQIFIAYHGKEMNIEVIPNINF